VNNQNNSVQTGWTIAPDVLMQQRNAIYCSGNTPASVLNHRLRRIEGPLRVYPPFGGSTRHDPPSGGHFTFSQSSFQHRLSSVRLSAVLYLLAGRLLGAVRLGPIFDRSSRNEAYRKEDDTHKIEVPAVDDRPERSRDVIC